MDLDKYFWTCDCDGVLASLMKSMAAWHNRVYGTDLSVHDKGYYALTPWFGCSKEETYRRLEQYYLSPEFNSTERLPYSREGIEIVAAANIPPVPTARPIYTQDTTAKWLEANFGCHIGDPFFTSDYRYNKDGLTKLDFLLELHNKHNKQVAIFEDCLETSTRFAEHGVKVYLITQPWNQTDDLHPNIKRLANTRLKNWEYFIEMVLSNRLE